MKIAKRHSIDQTEIATPVEKLEKLKNILSHMKSVLVAFSGGVDSSFLLKVAYDVLKDKAIGATAYSPVNPSGEYEEACRFATLIGVKHFTINTNELDDPQFVANPPERCFHCKSELFEKLTEIAGENNLACVVDGSNFDDIKDYRPGTKAAKKFKVRSPLKEVKLTKPEIRALSKEMNLPTWDRPASPCLASRIPYGCSITMEKLSRIDRAENFLRSFGVRELRVRDHDGIARIEVPAEKIHLFVNDSVRTKVIEKLKSLGYKYVTVDLQGYRTGSMNEVLKIDRDE